jgi:hypothetical protein
MLPTLRAWDGDPPPAAPRLLVVSTGTPEANRALGLRAPVLLDHTFAAGTAFGASGTPMAVLLDAELTVASELAAGSEAVMALLTRHAAAGASPAAVAAVAAPFDVIIGSLRGVGAGASRPPSRRQ